jgi:hypothetical protein
MKILAAVAVALVLAACQRKPAPGPPEQGLRAAPAGPSPAAGPPVRRLLLGRVVDLASFSIERTLSEPPESEVTDTAAAVGVVATRDLHVRGFRLSTGQQIWEQSPRAPCRSLQLAGGKVYAGCGDQLLAFATTGGDPIVVDKGGAGDPIVAGALVLSPHQDGRLSVFDAASGKVRASKIPAELAKAFHTYVIANPGGAGACVLGLEVGNHDRWTYRAGCYDDRLTRSWTKDLPVNVARERLYDVRQTGTRYLVLDDQSSLANTRAPPGPGDGLVMSWRDGSVTPFHDGTFATLEDARGQRLHADVDVFARTKDLVVDHEPFADREARVTGDDRRAFALIVNGATALAGVDRATGHTLFLVPLSLGALIGRFEVVEGFPIVRTRFSDRWVVTVHDPATGAVLYRDSRPLARGP